MKNIAKVITALYLGLLFLNTAFAQTPNTDSQAVILQLQEQIKVLEAKIVEIQTELKVTKSELVEVKEQLQLARTLRRGMTGEDVKQLQEFLKQFSDIYPEGLVTGFFGPLTETAVKRFQEKREIVNSGSPETTGFGQVGPRTISKLNELVVQVTGSSGKTFPEITVAPGNSNNPTEQASQLTVTPTSTPITPTSTPSGTIPATPAVPATTSSGGTGTPATPATPAVPATPNQPSPQTSSSSSSSSQDTTPPIISNVQTTNIAETSATTTWTTDELASSEVYYALSSPITATSTIKIIGADNVINHSVNLTGLSSSKIYYYVVVSKDSAGNTATSSEQSFTTLTPSPPPTSSWSNNSLSVSGEYQSITWNGNGYGAVYGWNGKLYFIKLDSNGNKLSESIIATAPNYVFWTNIVWDGSKYGVVWPEANPSNLRFATFDINGNVLSNIPVTAGTDNASTERPTLVWTGSEYTLIWSGGWPDNYNNPYIPQGIIYFTKIASDGQTFVINKKKSIVSGDARVANGPIVASAWNGENFGVVWQDIRDSGDSNNPALYFNILDSNGDKLIGNDVKISGAGRVGSPQIFTSESNYIVFWRESAIDNVNANSIYVAKLDSVGNKVLANQNLNTKGDNEIRPSVVKTENGYGVIWTSYPEQKLYFKSINSSANVIIDNELVSTVSGNNDDAYVAWNNSKYGVIWRNVQNNISQLYFGTK